MTKDEIVKLGMDLGLLFTEYDNFPSQLEKNIVVFNGCNGQRFLIDGERTDFEIYRAFGKALILYGMRLKVMDINSTLSITSDTTELPMHFD